MPRVIDAFEQFFDKDGDPLTHGWLWFLESGSVDTEKDTYFESSYNNPNTNPLQLDAEGRCPDVFGEGTYRVVLYANDPYLNEPGEQIDIKDPVGGEPGVGDFNDWDFNAVYQEGDIVKGSDGNFYASITSDNQLNDPVAQPSPHWERIDFFRIWNPYVVYNQGPLPIVDGSNSILYRSLVDNNVGNQPALTEGTFWENWATYAGAAQISGLKNLLLNGNFDVWQRGAVVFDVDNSYTADRWKIRDSNQHDRVEGHTYSAFGLQATGLAGAMPRARNVIELEPGGHPYPIVSGQVYTLSFWAKADTAHEVFFEMVYAEDSNGTNPIVIAPATKVGDTTGDWEFYYTSFTMPVDNPPSSCVCALLDIYADSPPTLTLSRVQLEKGDRATDYETASPEFTADLCRRYFQRYVGGPFGTGYGVNPTTARLFVPFVSRLRQVPTMTPFSPATLTIAGAGGSVVSSNIILAAASITGMFLGVTVTGLTAREALTGSINQGAYIDIDAEL